MFWTYFGSKPVKQIRCQSSSDISSDFSSRITSNAVSITGNENLSESSDAQSIINVINEIKKYTQQWSQTDEEPDNEKQSDAATKSVNTNEQIHEHIIHFNAHKSSSPKPFRNCFRRKSKSFESFFIPQNCQDYNSYERDKKQDQNQVIGKIENSFSSLRFPNLRKNTRSSSSAINTSVSSNQETLKKLLFSPQRAATATKLAELKLAHPISSRSSREGTLKFTQRHYQQSFSEDRHAKSETILPTKKISLHSTKNITVLLSLSKAIASGHQYQICDRSVDKKLELNPKPLEPTPPSPAPPDPSVDCTRQTFYIKDDKNTEQPGIIDSRKAFLKSNSTDVRIPLHENPTITYNIYNFKTLSKETELGQDIRHFEYLVGQNSKLPDYWVHRDRFKRTHSKQHRHQCGHTIQGYNLQHRQKECSKGAPTRQEQPSKRPTHISSTLLPPSNLAFWRREDLSQLQLDSPRHSVDNSTNIFIGEGSDIYQEYKERHSQEYSPKYYQRPVLGPEYPEAEFCQYPENIESRHFKTDHMARMGSLEDHERKVIIEFCHLLEKSKQLFNGLRELPQYGHKQWHSYFGRTFDVYTKLWKFQQQHRAVLDTKYGLKRWQIGEIASKIGQLYYHFYLRTSETAYLNEAYSFYFAIRGRSYYTKASKEDKCELMVKKLRYYARFIVVCLLLKKIKLVRDLIKELDRQIVEYGNTYDPDDQIEWTVVMDEVKAFIQAEPVVSVIHPDNYPIILSHRLNIQTTPPVERSALMTLSLQEVIVVGSSSYQVKFSELTMDMFRMLQTLEREPTVEIQQAYDDSPRHRYNVTPSGLNSKSYNLEAGAPHCDNPHKYLLFKPTPNQILVYLASSCDDLPPNGVLLVYISAEGQIATPSKHIEDVGYDIGGLITTPRNEVHRDANKDLKGAQAKYRDVNSFHPGDLFPFTRRPLFVIIDSDNSYAFQNMPRHFGQPLVILMSPVELPPTLNADRRHHGNLFTLFLHSPLTAFCYCCDIHTMSLVQWDKGQAFIDTFLAEASLIVTRSRIDPQYLSFMGDDFLRLLILRFIFCEVVLRMHRAFRTRTQLARSSPAIPENILEHPALTRIVMELAVHLQTRSHFQETSVPPNKE